jgi:hypothetical protein
MRRIDADVWVLTETHRDMSPGPEFQAVASIGADRPQKFGECWTMIWSRLPILGREDTSDPTRTACMRLQDPAAGAFIVFGTVLPWLGSRWRGVAAANGQAFHAALRAQEADWRRIRSAYPGDSFCLAGDFNQDLCSRHFYGSRMGREVLRAVLHETGLVCVTAHPHDPVRAATSGVRANIDHICLSQPLAKRQRGTAGSWPDPDEIGRRLTDHFGVWIDLDDTAPSAVSPIPTWASE